MGRGYKESVWTDGNVLYHAESTANTKLQNYQKSLNYKPKNCISLFIKFASIFKSKKTRESGIKKRIFPDFCHWINTAHTLAQDS